MITEFLDAVTNSGIEEIVQKFSLEMNILSFLIEMINQHLQLVQFLAVVTDNNIVFAFNSPLLLSYFVLPGSYHGILPVRLLIICMYIWSYVASEKVKMEK